MPQDITADRTIADAAALQEIVGEPTPHIANKERRALDRYFRRFLELCPFLCISTADADGNQDVSPRGDPPGFVRALDDRTILIPDRKGNRRVDTMRNILENPHVGLILFVPGVEEVVRINGRARITEDRALLSPSAVRGSVPALGIVVEIDAVFFHCAKAIMRSKLWDPETPITRSDFPSFARIVRDQREPDGSIEETADMISRDYRERLY